MLLDELTLQAGIIEKANGAKIRFQNPPILRDEAMKVYQKGGCQGRSESVYLEDKRSQRTECSM